MTRGGAWVADFPGAGGVTFAAGVAGMGGGIAGTPGLGTTVVIGLAASPARGGGWAVSLTGKSDLVLEVGGAPVRGGAVALGATGGMSPEGGRIPTFGIGFVTAVDQTGAVGACGTAVMLGGGGVGWIGRVVAARTLGRGVILVEAGLSGRGGRLIRNVSLFGKLMSGLSEGGGGVAESAILLFIRIYGKCTMAKLAIATQRQV